MASLTAVAAVQPVAVKGLAGSSFNGNKLALKRSRRIASRANLRYDSFTFLVDRNGCDRTPISSVAGLAPPWSPSTGRRACTSTSKTSATPRASRQTRTSSPPHRSATVDADHVFVELQSKFFETFVAPFTKRGLLLKFLLLGGGFTIAYLGSTASGDILPIKKGPQLPPTPGPRGKI
ncbi:hypothetical protein GW17_00007179 [Ensete ventricosum]|nr:hypothetical protein GW17_00007179 [Ensete ventricosum]